MGFRIVVLRIARIEKAAQLNRDVLFRFGTALLFIVGIMLFTIVRTKSGIHGVLLVNAAMIGGYMLAFCIAMAAAITAIVASQLGLPVSSTHIAVGGVFGVGFLREYLKVNYARMVEEIRRHHSESDPQEVEAFLARFEAANVAVKSEMLRELKGRNAGKLLSKSERKGLGRINRLELVKRSLLLLIVAAWLVTVPFSGLLGAMFFFMIRGIMLP